LSPKADYVTEISKIARLEKILPEVNVPSTSQIISAKADDNDLTDLKEEDFCNNEIVITSISSVSQSKPTYDCTYFRNKTLDQYSSLYRECSSKNFNYYRITNDTLCPLCKLGHDNKESIESRYKARFYFVKCEQREIEIVA